MISKAHFSFKLYDSGILVVKINNKVIIIIYKNQILLTVPSICIYRFLTKVEVLGIQADCAGCGHIGFNCVWKPKGTLETPEGRTLTLSLP